MAEMKLIADGLKFPEGPIAMPDSSIILVEIARGTLTRITPDGKKEIVAEPGGGPNGAAIGPDGACYICNNGGFEWHDRDGLLFPGDIAKDYSGGRIERVDLKTGKVEKLYTECNGIPLNGPNDIVFDKSGGFWFTDLGKGRGRTQDRGGLYYAKPDGSSIKEVVFPITSPNGVGLSPTRRPSMSPTRFRAVSGLSTSWRRVRWRRRKGRCPGASSARPRGSTSSIRLRSTATAMSASRRSSMRASRPFRRMARRSSIRPPTT